MSGSTITGFSLIAEGSDATPGLWNSRFQTLQDNIVSVNSAVIPPSVLSGTTWASIGLVANSSIGSDYIRFFDSSNQRSTYRVGSYAGGTADGLNLYDESGQTMIISFSKQSIRAYQQFVGPVFDTASDFVNASTLGTASDSTESRINAAIIQAAQQGKTGVNLPRAFYPYSASSVSFIHTLQMVREGGDWSVYDVRAYGANGLGVTSDRSAFISALSAVGTTGQIYLPAGSYSIDTNTTFAAGVTFARGAVLKPSSGVTLTFNVPVDATDAQIFNLQGTAAVAFGNQAVNDVKVIWFGFGNTFTAASNKSALIAAVAAGASAGAGATISLPWGGVIINGDIPITNKSMTIRGATPNYGYGPTAAGTTLIFSTGSTGFYMDATQDNVGSSDFCAMEDFKVDSSVTGAFTGVRFQGQKVFRRMQFSNCTTAGLTCTDLGNSFEVDSCSFYANPGAGMTIAGAQTTVFNIHNSNFRLNNTGLDIRGGKNFSIEDSVIESNYGIGLILQNPDLASFGWGYFKNVHFENNASVRSSYQMTYATTASATYYPTSMMFENCVFAPTGAQVPAQKALSLAANCLATRFHNCRFSGDDGTSILVTATLRDDTQFIDCTQVLNWGASSSQSFMVVDTGGARLIAHSTAKVNTLGDAVASFAIPDTKSMTLTLQADAFAYLIISDAGSAGIGLYSLMPGGTAELQDTQNVFEASAAPTAGHIGISRAADVVTIKNSVGGTRTISLNVFGTKVLAITNPA